MLMHLLPANVLALHTICNQRTQEVLVIVRFLTTHPVFESTYKSEILTCTSKLLKVLLTRRQLLYSERRRAVKHTHGCKAVDKQTACPTDGIQQSHGVVPDRPTWQF